MGKSFIYKFFYFSFFLFVIGSSFFFFIIYESHNLFLIDNEALFLKKNYVYGKDNEFLFEFYNKKIDNTFFNEIPIHCVQAFISKEDSGFFKHRGLSFKAILRAFWVNLKSFKFVQGGSTITQQMIKLKRGNLKKTWNRKLLEQIMALAVESFFTKEEIFQEYLRILYFGNGIFGIKDASKKFWNKKPSELNVLESATLAGIIQSPEYFNPQKNYSNCLKKRNFVLRRMFEDGYLKKDEYEKFLNEPLIINYYDESYKDEQILFSLEGFFEKNYQKYLNNESVFYTTFDKNLQEIVSRIFYKNIKELKNKNKNIEGGCILVDLETNEIRAIVEGYDNKKFPYLHSTKIKRQIGSLIKPLIFYYAFLNGDDKNTIYNDSPLEEDFKWNPNNFNKKFYGDISIEKAFIESNNIVPVRILKKYGIKSFLNFLKNFSIFSDLKEYYSIALGCLESNPFDMYSFIKFLHDGSIDKPYFCRKVNGKNGNLFYKKNEEINNDKIYFQENKANEIKKIMFKLGERIKKVLKINFDKPVFVKTGTTNGAKNCWFMGSDGKYALIVYVGCDNQENLWKKNITSLRSATKIGISIFEKI